jgi:hypothetical protein
VWAACKLSARRTTDGLRPDDRYHMVKYSHTGLEQVQATLLGQHLRLMDSVGKMLLIGYSWAQLFMGISFQLLSKPDIPLRHLPASWYHHIRLFLSRSDASIDVFESHLCLPQLLRTRDQNLMDAFLTLNRTPEKLRNLNYCRLYFGWRRSPNYVMPMGPIFFPQRGGAQNYHLIVPSSGHVRDAPAAGLLDNKL